MNHLSMVSEGAGPSRELTNNDNWSLEKWTRVYADAVQCLHERYNQNKMENGGNGVLAWDKDDEPGMNFVAACANIRAHIFNIQMKSLFEIKSMVGNLWFGVMVLTIVKLTAF